MASEPSAELGQLRVGDQALHIRRARKSDVTGVVALLADDVLGRSREADPESQSYRDAFAAVDAARFYERLGFAASHHGLKLALN